MKSPFTTHGTFLDVPNAHADDGLDSRYENLFSISTVAAIHKFGPLIFSIVSRLLPLDEGKGGTSGVAPGRNGEHLPGYTGTLHETGKEHMISRESLTEIRSGMDFDAYMDQWRTKNALPMKGLDPVARRTRFYSKYNLERQERVMEVWQPSRAFLDAVAELQGPADWLFITDDWCVDSAYSLPLVKWASDQHADITLRILLKDEHPAIMDQFLTDGRRSIPKLAGISEDGTVQFSWGPQPDAIRDIRKELMEGGAEGRVVSSTTVEWYANEGWLEVERELTALFSDG